MYMLSMWSFCLRNQIRDTRPGVGQLVIFRASFFQMLLNHNESPSFHTHKAAIPEDLCNQVIDTY